MSNRSTHPARRLLAITVGLALAAPGMALAQTAKEAELEARIVQLEAMVRELAARQAAPAAVASPAMPAAPVREVATAPLIQKAPITPGANPGTVFTFGGFIKADTMWTDTDAGEIPDGSAGRLFYVPSAIPVGGVDEGVDLDYHAQFSRFWLAADSTLDSGDKLRAFLEFDLFGGGSNAFLGNEVATHTHGVTVRHAFVTWNNWLAGQTWSNFFDVAALPESVDFVGPTEGTIFVRQPQLRYSKGPWSFSAENPETTITPYMGSGARISSDDNSLPDLTARYTKKGDWGHLSIGALARQLRYENPATGVDATQVGAGLSISGRYAISPADDIRFMLSGGDGIGRYLGLGIASDVVLDAGGELQPVDAVGGFVAWRHAFSPKLRGSLFYSAAQFDHDTALTGTAVTERVHSWHANLIYSLLPKLDVGAELIWGERALENGADGELRRLHTHVKYSF